MGLFSKKLSTFTDPKFFTIAGDKLPLNHPNFADFSLECVYIEKMIIRYYETERLRVDLRSTAADHAFILEILKISPLFAPLQLDTLRQMMKSTLVDQGGPGFEDLMTEINSMISPATTLVNTARYWRHVMMYHRKWNTTEEIFEFPRKQIIENSYRQVPWLWLIVFVQKAVSPKFLIDHTALMSNTITPNSGAIEIPK